MFGLDNPVHLLFLGVLLLLVFGAKRLPEMGRSLGAGMRGFKESVTGEGPQPAELVAPRQDAASSGEQVQAPSAAREPQA
jgi:sec-independent protein translocase protein TatA